MINSFIILCSMCLMFQIRRTYWADWIYNRTLRIKKRLWLFRHREPLSTVIEHPNKYKSERKWRSENGGGFGKAITRYPAGFNGPDPWKSRRVTAEQNRFAQLRSRVPRSMRFSRSQRFKIDPRVVSEPQRFVRWQRTINGPRWLKLFDRSTGSSFFSFF